MMFTVIKPVTYCAVTSEGCCCLPLPMEGTDQSQRNLCEVCGLESDIGTGSENFRLYTKFVA